jgi:hypothetical protein
MWLSCVGPCTLVLLKIWFRVFYACSHSAQSDLLALLPPFLRVRFVSFHEQCASVKPDLCSLVFGVVFGSVQLVLPAPIFF